MALDGGDIYITNVHTIRERELANALRHAIEWIEEAVPGQDTRWYRNVLGDALSPGEKQLASPTPETIDIEVDRG
jgi:hypothetical protein